MWGPWSFRKSGNGHWSQRVEDNFRWVPNKNTYVWINQPFCGFVRILCIVLYIAWQVENQSAERVEIILQQETGPVLVWVDHHRWRRHCMILKVLLQAQAQAIPFSLGETAVGDEEGMSDPEEGRYCSCLRKRMSSARTSRAPSHAVFVFFKYVFRVQQCFVIVKLFPRRKRYLQLHNVIPRPKGRCRIGRDRPNCIHFDFSDIPIQL